MGVISLLVVADHAYAYLFRETPPAHVIAAVALEGLAEQRVERLHRTDRRRRVRRHGERRYHRHLET